MRAWLVLVLASPLLAQSPSNELHQRLEAAVPKGFWGAVLVARDGRVLFAKGYGAADESGKPVTLDSLFDVGSVSKQFTAAAILKLEEQGRLATTDPIAKHFADVPADKGLITIHHLLTHTSGIPHDLAFGPAEYRDRDTMVARVLNADLRGKPGARFQYSNVGYFLLAALVERASGQEFEGYLKKYVFGPAGMRDTGFVQDRDLDRRKQTVRAWNDIRGTVLDYPWNWANRGATGVVTTVRDLWTWDRALQAGKVLSPRSQRKLFTRNMAGYGYGWMIGKTAGGTPRHFHGGSTRGYNAYLVRFPAERVVVSIATNNAGNAQVLASRFESVLFAQAGEHDRDSIATLVDALTHPDRATRRAAVQALYVRKQVPAPLAPKVIAAFKSKGLTQGEASKLNSLLAGMGPDCIPFLLTGLTDTKWVVRRNCASLLGRIREAAVQVVPALIQRLEDEQLDVRIAAAYAVLEFGEAARPAVPQIRKVTADVRARLKRSGDRIARSLEAKLKALPPK